MPVLAWKHSMNVLQHIQTSRRGLGNQKSASNSRYCHILALVPAVVMALMWGGGLYILTHVAQASRVWLSTSSKSSFGFGPIRFDEDENWWFFSTQLSDGKVNSSSWIRDSSAATRNFFSAKIYLASNFYQKHLDAHSAVAWLWASVQRPIKKSSEIRDIGANEHISQILRSNRENKECSWRGR